MTSTIRSCGISNPASTHIGTQRRIPTTRNLQTIPQTTTLLLPASQHQYHQNSSRQFGSSTRRNQVLSPLISQRMLANRSNTTLSWQMVTRARSITLVDQPLFRLHRSPLSCKSNPPRIPRVHPLPLQLSTRRGCGRSQGTAICPGRYNTYRIMGRPLQTSRSISLRHPSSLTASPTTSHPCTQIWWLVKFQWKRAGRGSLGAKSYGALAREENLRNRIDDARKQSSSTEICALGLEFVRGCGQS